MPATVLGLAGLGAAAYYMLRAKAKDERTEKIGGDMDPLLQAAHSVGETGNKRHANLIALNDEHASRMKGLTQSEEQEQNVEELRKRQEETEQLMKDTQDKWNRLSSWLQQLQSDESNAADDADEAQEGESTRRKLESIRRVNEEISQIRARPMAID